MAESVILRFKDGEEPTFRRHQELADSLNCVVEGAAVESGVWWAWWKKTDNQEPFPESELTEAAARALKEGLDIGLVDRDNSQYGRAVCTRICQAGGEALPSPDPCRTPSYYNSFKFPAWFYLTNITEMERSEWERQFGPVPAGVATIYFPGKYRGRLVSNIKDLSEPAGEGLIHLSDLHFGSGHRFTAPGVGSSYDGRPRLIDRLKEIDIRPAGVVISGDFLTKGNPKGYPHALSFLNDLADLYELSPARVVLVPGNHDIPVSTTDPGEAYPATGEFIQFLKMFYKTETLIERVHEFQGIDGVHYVLGTVNSSQFRSEATMDFGYVEEFAAEAVIREIDFRGHGPRFWRFLVMHHHILTASADEHIQWRREQEGERVRPVSVTMNGGFLVDLCKEFKIDAILRGHQHLPFVGAPTRIAGVSPDRARQLRFKDRMVLELAAGAAGAASEMMDSLMNENSFSYYRFSGDDISVKAYAYNEKLRVYLMDGWDFTVQRRSAG